MPYFCHYSEKREFAPLINVQDGHPRLHCDRVEPFPILDGPAKLFALDRARERSGSDSFKANHGLEKP